MKSKIKRALAVGMSVAMVAALCVAPSITGCAAKAKAKSNCTLTLWGSQNDQAMLTSMAASFKKKYTDYNYTIKLGVCGEDVARTNVTKDLDTAADVYAFASDQTAALVSAGALTPVTIDTAKIKAANSATSITAVTIGKYIYAYPSSNNSFFLYYNKSMLSSSNVKSLESIMSKKLASGVKNFAMNISTAWYNSSFFLTAGCKLFGNSGTVATQCDFNNKKGIAAATYMINLAKNSKFTDFSSAYDSDIVQNFKQKKIASCVSGTWNAVKIKAALGSNYAACKLPNIKVNGKSTQMKSFASIKCFGVNPHSKHIKAAMELSEYITSQAMQLVRFKTTGASPTNKVLAANAKALSSNPAAAAEAAQVSAGGILQPSITQMNNFWTPVGNLGTQIENGKTTTKTLQSDLNKMVQNILAKI